MKKIALLFIAFVNVSFFSEEDFVSSIKSLSSNYFSNPRTKLELFFDQPKYAPGDTVRFRTWYVDAANLKTVTGVEIVHIALFDQTGQKKMSQWAVVSNGLAANKFVIPENFSSGNYLLVAFTERMKNFDQSLFYQYQFQVVGKNEFEKKPSRDTVAFFVEGGTLVTQLENNLAVRYAGVSKKMNLVVKESGKEIVNLELLKDSIGTFRLTPKVGETYEAEYIVNGKSQTTSLPKTINSGVSLIYNSDTREIGIQRSNNEVKPRSLYLLVYTGKGLVFYSPISIENKSKIALPQNVFDGIAQLVIVDSDYKLWNSRVIFSTEKQNEKVVVQNLNGNYGTRSQVKLNIQLQNSGRKLSENKVSCRVVSGEMFGATKPQTDYLTFGSDLSDAFSTRIKHANSLVTNNYLITQTCPWFNWQQIIEKKSTSPVYKAEQYLQFSGRAISAKDGQPLKDSTLLMFFLEKNLNGYETYVTTNGQFSFPLVLNVTSRDHFFYTASYKGRDLNDVKLKLNDRDSLVKFAAEPWSEKKDVIDKYFVYSLQRKTVNNSYSFFLNPQTSNDASADPNEAMEKRLRGSDVKLNLADFLMMPTMAEVAKELLKGVEYRKIGSRDVVRVNTTHKVPSNYAGPLYVINGQITKDPTHFLDIKPSDVISIKVVKESRKLMALGSLGANGVILINTKTPISINEKNRIDFSGLTPRLDRAQTNGINKQVPDLRSSLILLPDILPNGIDSSEIQFNTSDDVGKFILQVYGLTEDGASVYSEFPFNVDVSGN